MNNFILTEKELNYVETLYLSCNLEDFDYCFDQDVKFENPKYQFDFALSVLAEQELHSAEFLGVSGHREWYDLGLYRLGIMDYDQAKKSNQYNVTVQYNSETMFHVKPDLSNLPLPFSGKPSQFKIKRIDITKIFKSPVDYTVDHGYISPYRKQANYYGTIYLGHRKNGNVFRMYSKTKELEENKDYKKIERFSQYFGDIKNLYTFELELHRVHMRERLGIDTLADIEKVHAAYRNIVGKIRIYEDNDLNKKMIASNNRSRVESVYITEFGEFDRIDLKKNVGRSEKFLIDRTLKQFDKYIEDMDFEDVEKEYSKLINILIEKRLKKDFEIYYEQDQDHKNDLERTRSLVNSDELYQEAHNAFGDMKQK
jgi:hypothetical protein